MMQQNRDNNTDSYNSSNSMGGVANRNNHIM